MWQYRRSARARIAATRPLPHRLYRPDLVRKFGLLSSAGKQSARTGLGHGLAGDRYRCSQKRAVASDDLTVEQYELARRMSSDSFGDAAIATSGYGLGRYSRRIVLGLWAYAGLLEYLQHFSPGRHPSVEDFAASALGAMCGGLAVLLLGRSRVIRRICRM